MTQTSAILDHLRAGGTLTPGQALEEFGCFRLAARVNDCRKLLEPGEVIVSERWTTPRGKSVARYSLVRREPAQVTLWSEPVRVTADATQGMARTNAYGPRRGL